VGRLSPSRCRRPAWSAIDRASWHLAHGEPSLPPGEQLRERNRAGEIYFQANLSACCEGCAGATPRIRWRTLSTPAPSHCSALAGLLIKRRRTPMLSSVPGTFPAVAQRARWRTGPIKAPPPWAMPSRRAAAAALGIEKSLPL